MVNILTQQICIGFNPLIQNTNHSYPQLAYQMSRIIDFFGSPQPPLMLMPNNAPLVEQPPPRASEGDEGQDGPKVVGCKETRMPTKFLGTSNKIILGGRAIQLMWSSRVQPKIALTLTSIGLTTYSFYQNMFDRLNFLGDGKSLNPPSLLATPMNPQSNLHGSTHYLYFPYLIGINWKGHFMRIFTWVNLRFSLRNQPVEGEGSGNNKRLSKQIQDNEVKVF